MRKTEAMQGAGARLSRQDLDRIRYARGDKKADTSGSLFGPESVTWRVNREGALLFGGGRALLMQVAHPLVAAGVAQHSNFRANPLQRLQRTLDLTLTITFGDLAAAIKAVRTIEKRHQSVRGNLKADIGPFPRGTPYDASDPQLQFWVHATLVDTALQVYEMFVGPLPHEVKAAYYEESKITARFFGIPAKRIPRTLEHFDEYMAEMVHGNILAVSAASREIAASILSPPLPIGVKQALQTSNLFTIGLLPPVIRNRYGFTWNFAWQAALDTAARAGRGALPLLPSMVRHFPHARAAQAAASGAL